MGMSTITASRIYKGQLEGRSGEEELLEFDEFPNVGLAKTYNVDKQVPDSAGTATALFTGVKTNYGVVGMDIIEANSSQSESVTPKLTSIIDWAISAKKKTGFVTTTRVTHATPGNTIKYKSMYTIPYLYQIEIFHINTLQIYFQLLCMRVSTY